MAQATGPIGTERAAGAGGAAPPDEGLSALIRPRSVAVVGASSDLRTPGGLALKYLERHGFGGSLYLVNPRYEELLGRRCYPSLLELPEPVDLVIVAVPQRLVLETVEHAARRGVRGAIVFSAGYADVGPEGVRRQEELRDAARAAGMRVCGPNCLGIVNVVDHTAAAFSKVCDREALLPGRVGIASQSGALGGSLLDRAQDVGLGVAYMVSTGNEADVEVAEVIAYMVGDPQVEVIAAFVESFRRPERLRDVALQAQRAGKPIVVLKTGASQLGQRAIASHTGALTAPDAVHSAFFRQYGVIRAESLDDLLNTTLLLSRAGAPAGRRVGVLSLSGGAGAIVADACARLSLELPPPQEITQERLREAIPAFGSTENPADTSGMTFSDPTLFPRSMAIFGQDEGFDAVVSVMTTVGGEMGEIMARAIVEVGQTATKPVATVWLAGSISDSSIGIIRPSRVPVYRSIEGCFAALEHAADYAARRARLAGQVPAWSAPAGARERAAALLAAAGPVLTERESAEVLALYGIPTPRQQLARSLDEALAAANRIGYPVALKVESPDVLHKSREGGVRLGVRDAADLREAWEAIRQSIRSRVPTADVRGLLVAEMVRPGTELILGLSQDPQFGPTIAAGLGGVFVEALRDVSLRLAPLGEADAREMLAELRAYPLLAAADGSAGLAVEAVVRALQTLAAFAQDFGDVLQTVDVNPLVVWPDGGACAVDALIMHRSGAA